MAQLIPKGRIALANDPITAGLVRDTGTDTRAALVEVAGPLVSEALTDPNVSNIVSDAVDTAVPVAVTNELNTSPRIPKQGLTDRLRVKDLSNRVSFEARPDGALMLGPTQVSPAADRVRYYDLDGKVAFEIRANGKTFIGDPIFGTGGGSSGVTVTRVIQVNQWGQSLGEGRARPYGPKLDPDDSRILMWDWSSSTLKTATVPLSSQQQQVGLSPATVFARKLLRQEPPGTIVVIVNAAVGGSGLVAQPSSGSWAIDTNSPNPHLYPIAKTAYTAARAAIISTYGIVPQQIMLWNQGEADSTTGAAYGAAYDALVNDFRSFTAIPDLPFVNGSMLPEYYAADAGRLAVDATQQDAPRRLTNVSYVPAPPNGGGSASTTDLVHGSREAMVILGNDEYDGYLRAVANELGSTPDMPTTVKATRSGSTLSAECSPPFSRYTLVKFEYSADGGAWVNITKPPVALTCTATVTDAVIRVRVTVTNDVGTTDPTTPVTAIGT